MATGTIPNTPLSSVSLFNSNTPFYAPNLPAGIANGLAWTQVGTTGYYTATITVKGVKSTSALSTTIQCDATNTTDASNCWLLTAYPTTGIIHFIVAGNPATPANFPISWAVAKL